MTVQNDSNVKTYTGNGVTTVFPYDFFIPGDTATDQTNVQVTLLTIATGLESDPLNTALWSITGVGSESYGNVTYTGGGTPLPATHKINIRRVLPYEQNLDLTTQSAYFPELLEEQLDLMVFQTQQLAEEVGRAVKVAVGSTDNPAEIIDSLLDAATDAAASASAAATSASSAATAASTAAADAVADAQAAIAADVAAAEAAKVAAQLAETNAETAEVAAEAAQAAAEAAASGLTPVNTQIVAAPAKTTLADADSIGVVDSADSQALKETTFGQLKTNIAGKQTIWVPAGAMMARTTNGPASGTAEMTTNKNMVKTLDFDTTTQEFAQFDIRMPKSWDEGTVSFIPVWSHAATTVNFGVVWGLDAVAISDNETLDVAFGTEQTSTDTGGTTNRLYQGPESSAITIAGTPSEGDYVQFRIHRNPANGSDTMAIDAGLHGILLLINTNTTRDD